MEQIHGIDVSWMTHHGGPKDRVPNLRRSTFPVPSPEHSYSPSPCDSPTASLKGADENSHDDPDATPKANGTPTQPRPIPPKPGFTRGASANGDRSGTSPSSVGSGGGSPSLSRKASWFSNLSSKFSSGSGGAAGPNQSANANPPPQATTNSPTKDAELSVPRITPAKNAVLQHAAKHAGEGPYTPAPPRTGQTAGGFLHVFRRLSSSGAGQLGGPGAVGKGAAGNNHHGLVERRVLNVDRDRERCPLEDLHQAKLRRVAFCVDVEVAPMPKYADAEAGSPKICAAGPKTEKRKLVEKGEGEALKNPKSAEEQKEQDGAIKVSEEEVPREPEKEGEESKETSEEISPKPNSEPAADNNCGTKKKEKKKRSEEERKARKEKKRKLAEANGQIPLEIHLDTYTDTSDPSAPATPRTQVAPTTNPVRIYRRCCQLRETPILKKITEQLLSSSNTTSAGVVEKLDLMGYWMQLPDLVTLGDFLAVVPVKEVILENCGLTDEGLRVVLAGLLATKKANVPRKRTSGVPNGLVGQGGVVERLVLKNNKIGPEGWRHLCLFVYMCRSLISLDVAAIPFPKPPSPPAHGHGHFLHHDEKKTPLDMCALLAKAIGERLGGSTLEQLNLSNTGLHHAQLGRLLDGVMQCGVRRLGLAHLDLDLEGLEHIKRYLTSGKCQGLDLGGNDLRDHCESLGSVMEEDNTLWALSLAECNLKPASLCKLLAHLAKMSNFRFLDLSHNHDLFDSEPSAVGVLRRYLPKMKTVKRLHLSDCALKAEQLIALAEVIPEMDCIAHISVLQNPELSKLADASTEETQEEASALYASLLAAARLSPNLVCVDIDVPTDGSGEIVKALAKQIVAYCLRNMERLPMPSGAATLGETLATIVKDPEYPDVLQHLVGHDVTQPDGPEDEDMAPDDDYIVGGTGVAKALACCLNNRGDESRRQSGEFIREVEDGVVVSKSDMPGGRAKDVSKHLLLSARKIRHRLDPALVRSKALADKNTEERNTYHRLLFLQRTLDGIINRFEDEFPETKETADSAVSIPPPENPLEKTTTRTSLSTMDGENEADREPSTTVSDAEEEAELIRTSFSGGVGGGGGGGLSKGSLSRQSSNLSLSSQALNREEGHALRAGHKFRSGWVLTSEQYQLLASGAGLDEIEWNATTRRVFNEMLDELGDEELLRLRDEKGAVRVFKEHRQRIVDRLREADPEYWIKFVESQQKAKANVELAQPKPCGAGDGAGGVGGAQGRELRDESAVTD